MGLTVVDVPNATSQALTASGIRAAATPTRDVTPPAPPPGVCANTQLTDRSERT